mmetsp:Transcript_5783/g.11808  ORF Transcript_5783/g.11808 Transcript_5783/m.11808 type:complete len:441 (-) Transcript_5783:411-1733(-)
MTFENGEQATLYVRGREVKLPVVEDSFKNLYVDISKLYGSTKICTYDPGYTSTACCTSTITYIDGGKGVLLYRGYPIEQLAEKADFVDSTHLLLYGELPDAKQKKVLDDELKHHGMVHEKLIDFYRGFKSDAHPMAMMVGVVGAISAFYEPNGGGKWRDRDNARLSCVRLIAKMPTLAAMAYKTSIGQPIVYPRNDFTMSENFLYMMFSQKNQVWKNDPVLSRAMDIIMILHMDHEQNASTSTVRNAGSSQANPFACVSAGIACLWGPAHGGANEAVLNMLAEIGSVDRIPEYIKRVKDPKDSFRLMGFGHRVYKAYDPRARIMRGITHQVLQHLKLHDPILDLSMELEKIALTDEYFVKRNLYPNIDFYSGICLRAMGVPVAMFTVLFAVARTVGWTAQWFEMATEPVPRISRPRQVYAGASNRDYVPVERRQIINAKL